ncbi:hypothetical protein swp_2322 [Shewanella piezotolerans WP3]|uniref:Uncharacterized protein n=1 Tax=Shewanella piezotolerans (strain WP3 / JCM 13877) TaxID=225849 RepID=B8CNU9_SHEPW|nr:hypothetical protein swp_2322 [Shewanella piezotolerans WP3]
MINRLKIKALLLFNAINSAMPGNSCRGHDSRSQRYHGDPRIRHIDKCMLITNSNR